MTDDYVYVTENEGTDIEPQIAEVDVPETVGHVVNCSKLNVRSGPTKNCDILTIIHLNDVVMVDSEYSDDEWYKIRVNDIDGYCMKKYINV